MKKKTILLIVLGVVIALAVAAFATINYYVKQARSLYAQIQYTRATMHKYLDQSRIYITENADVVGEFTLEELRTDAPGAQIDALFDESEQEPVDAFREKSWGEQIRWYREAENRYSPQWDAAPLRLTLDSEHWDITPVLEALNAMPRTAPVSSVAVRINGGYQITPEQAGTTLNEDVVCAELLSRLNAQTIELGQTTAYTWTYELTNSDCYAQPTVTRTSAFDYDALLQRDAADLTICVDTRGAVQTINVLDYIYMDGNKIAVDTQKLQDEIAKWAQAVDTQNVPYVFASEDRGEVEIPFMLCNYSVDTDALYRQLEKQLKALDVTPVTAAINCTDAAGAPYGLEDTYIAVDKESQTVTFYKDGELIVHSDVVTGLPWGGHDTPIGLFDVFNKQTDCWLIGSDFYVHVDYWMGFIGTMYGLHDADWREEGEFGGEIYLKNGSHGCVNTPKGAMQTIFENAEVGMPVLVFE